MITSTRPIGESLRWQKLSNLPGLSTRDALRLLEAYGNINTLFEASEAQLRTQGITHELYTVLQHNNAEEEHMLSAWLSDPAHHLVTLLDEQYPPLLREIPGSPLVLYVAGNIDCLAAPQIAIVGSRNATLQGRKNAHAFARALAQTGLTVTSGLAQGIDAAAHEGALDAEGQTVAVIGTGANLIYPPRHAALAERIKKSGAVVSEFALGTPPRRQHFPRRNRLISGLGLGVLVVEAALQSGSLITARLAGEQGREVFAIPGSIHAPLSKGCHVLLKQGAKLVESAQDILEEFAGFRSHKAPANHATQSLPVRGQVGKLLRHIGHDPIDVDTLVEASGLTAESISPMLLQLELDGLIEPSAGGKYTRCS